MKKLVISLLVLTALFLSADDTNCYTIIVGKDASASGSVLIAHNEDDRGKNFFVDIHRVHPREHPRGKMIHLKNNGILSQVKNTLGFLWLEIAGTEFGDAYVNDRGVVVTTNSCPSREDTPRLLNGGIGFMLRRIIAQRAKTAREAVELAGSLIETYGYYSAGRSYCFADAKEGWILHAVQGKHWMARRIPDNHVAVIANYYTIRSIDLMDSSNQLGSSDIVEYARERGWYDEQRDKEFDFASVYSRPDVFTAEYNILRQWRGTNLLGKTQFQTEDRFPFSFIPKKKIKIEDLFEVLRDHYEGTPHDLTDGYKNGTPNKTEKRTICTDSTQFSFVASLRGDMPPELRCTLWLAFRRPDSNGYTPWFPSISDPPNGYATGTPNPLEHHFSRPESHFTPSRDLAFWRFARLSQLVDEDYKERIRPVRKKWRNLEDYAFKELRKNEKQFLYLLSKNRKIAVNLITNFVHNLEYKKWFIAEECISEIQEK